MAARLDLEIPAGTNVEFVVDVVGGPASLTGYTGAMKIRELRSDELPLAEVSPESIVVNPSTRQVAVTILGTETAAYDWRRGVYDVVISGPLGDWLLVEGRVINYPIVTRED